MLNKLTKTPTGKVSRKSFMMIVSFIITMFVGIWIVICDTLINVPLTTISKEVFDSLLIFVASLTSASVIDKKITTKNKPEE